MKEIILSIVAGLAVGILFKCLKLPIPAPALQNLPNLPYKLLISRFPINVLLLWSSRRI
ncbi:XapX domain-containing protein [Peribacillus sp. Hz7]|uniref:XapX domain-containing protein n=1 Tax=Peribacillus sp. Hz7 TaxID=3344873 RepID=UPI0035CC9FC6